ncbi:MAG: hypothetical protein Q6A79_01920 [Lactiplantibacillus plantarum]|nr:hypothetical protein [Lactiplantibacillus plantarum]
MKLINIHRKHINVELELNLRDWKDAILWGLLAVIVIVPIYWVVKL